MADKLRILTLNSISAAGLKLLPHERYEVAAQLDAPDAVLVRSQDMHAMQLPASIKAIGRAGAGTNNIPVQAMSERGVPVFNAPGANANAVKELVIAGLLLAARNLVPAVRFVDGLRGSDEEIKRQLRQIRKWLGAGGNVQLTDGEVTLRPAGELIELIRYARAIGLVPMLMTHGEAFRLRPAFLHALMLDGGLSEICVHIDTTQRGRRDAAYRNASDERELMALRDEFAALIRQARHTTRRRCAPTSRTCRSW